MTKSDLDSNKYQRALQAALQIKGVKNAPNQINTDQISVVVDALQSGFAIYENFHIDQTHVLAGAGDQLNFDIFSPIASALNALSIAGQNRLFESRILGLNVRLINAPDTEDGDSYTLRLGFENPGINDLIAGGPVTFYHAIRSVATLDLQNDAVQWALPFTTYQGTANVLRNMGGPNQWNGHLPAGVGLRGVLLKEVGNFDAAASIEVNVQGVRTPRGCYLPL